MATHSSVLTWRILLTGEPDVLQSMGSQRAGHDWVTNTFTFSVYSDILWYTHIYICEICIYIYTHIYTHTHTHIYETVKIMKITISQKNFLVPFCNLFLPTCSLLFISFCSYQATMDLPIVYISLHFLEFYLNGMYSLSGVGSSFCQN